jgi:isoaspartyl peptidase/L-asparaginase-like protein (Ntn-hydrolase superfamily)
MVKPRILVHLGASTFPAQFQAETLKSAERAVLGGYAVAETGASAEDIVAATVSILEDSPVTDAGIGSFYNALGQVQMDAGMMTGDKRYGAIASVHGIRNPIKAARVMLDDPSYSILVGEGAMDFIRKNGFETLPDEAFVTDFNKYVQQNLATDSLTVFLPDHGTVGCVVRDIRGNIAAGTSTGGTPSAPKGRVGDSPFPGCGVWADDADAAVSATGYGESILTELLAATAARFAAENGAMKGAERAIQKFARTPKSYGGVVLIVKETGEYGIAHNTSHMPHAWLTDDGTVVAKLSA